MRRRVARADFTFTSVTDSVQDFTRPRDFTARFHEISRAPGGRPAVFVGRRPMAPGTPFEMVISAIVRGAVVPYDKL